MKIKKKKGNIMKPIIMIVPQSGREEYFESMTACANRLKEGRHGLTATASTIVGNIANVIANPKRTVAGFKFRYATEEEMRKWEEAKDE
jgi:hypothetical protein